PRRVGRQRGSAHASTGSLSPVRRLPAARGRQCGGRHVGVPRGVVTRRGGGAARRRARRVVRRSRRERGDLLQVQAPAALSGGAPRSTPQVTTCLRSAKRTSSAVLWRSSFFMICLRCVSTVF